MYLNIGGGGIKMTNTLSLDMRELEGVDIIADARKIPRPDDFFEGALASHVIEHFVKAEHTSLVLEWRRVIQPGGKIYIACPDIEVCCRYFIENYKGKRDYWYQCLYGLPQGPSMQHLSGLTKPYLQDLMDQCGFHDLRWFTDGASLDMHPYGTKPEDHNIIVVGTKGKMPTGKFGQPQYQMTGGYKEAV
jgi:hypothetical protein